MLISLMTGAIARAGAGAADGRAYSSRRRCEARRSLNTPGQVGAIFAARHHSRAAASRRHT